MDNQDQLLAEFRRTVISRYIIKGIRPPVRDSEEETMLFNNWIKGRNILGEDKNE